MNENILLKTNLEVRYVKEGNETNISMCEEYGIVNKGIIVGKD